MKPLKSAFPPTTDSLFSFLVTPSFLFVLMTLLCKTYFGNIIALEDAVSSSNNLSGVNGMHLQ